MPVIGRATIVHAIGACAHFVVHQPQVAKMSAITAVDRVEQVKPDAETEALLAPLTASRRAHSLEVGRKAESAAALA